MTASAMEVVRGHLSPETMVLLGSPRFRPGVWRPDPAEAPLADELVWEGLVRKVENSRGAFEPTAAGLTVATVIRQAGVAGDGRRTLLSLSGALAERTGLPLEVLRSARRDAGPCRARAIFALLAREDLHRTNGEIGAWLKKDTSSIPDIRRRGAALVAAEPHVAELVADLRAWLAGADA